MRDRIAAVGGTLTVDSAPGRGTRVEVSVPDLWQHAGPTESPVVGRCCPGAVISPDAASDQQVSQPDLAAIRWAVHLGGAVKGRCVDHVFRV